MNATSEKITSSKFKAVLKAVKFLLWISAIGLGFTLIQTTGLIFTTNESIVDVGIYSEEKINTQHFADGNLVLNKGSFMFQADTLLDKVLFKHVRGYYHFIPSLFNFSICLILLLIVRNIEINSPYSLQIARKIQWIGFIYIAFGIISILVSLYTHSKFIEFSNDMLPDFSSLRNDMSGIIIGVFVLILAFIYRVGVRFQEENRLTI